MKIVSSITEGVQWSSAIRVARPCQKRVFEDILGGDFTLEKIFFNLLSRIGWILHLSGDGVGVCGNGLHFDHYFSSCLMSIIRDGIFFVLEIEGGSKLQTGGRTEHKITLSANK